MSIRLGEVCLAAFFLFVSAGCIWVGTQFNYYNRLGPGAGFFPIWIGALLAVFSASLLLQTFRQRGAPSEPLFADRTAGFRVVGTLVFVVAASAAMTVFGFRLTMLVFSLLAPLILQRLSPVLVGIVAVVLSFGVAYAFETWLGVQLPKASINALRALGL